MGGSDLGSEPVVISSGLSVAAPPLGDVACAVTVYFDSARMPMTGMSCFVAGPSAGMAKEPPGPSTVPETMEAASVSTWRTALIALVGGGSGRATVIFGGDALGVSPPFEHAGATASRSTE